MVSDSGSLERPLPLVRLGNITPVVSLVEQSDEFFLEWHWSRAPSEEEKPRDTDKRSLLDAFIKLDGATPEAYLKFARQYGVLLLCEHGVPTGHNPEAFQRAGCSPTGLEPVSVWRHFARHIKATLSIAGSLHRKEIGSAEDWATIFEENPDVTKPIPWWERSPEADKLALTDIVQEYLELGNVSPRFWWINDIPTITLDGPGVLGTLAVQLAFAVSASAGLAVCGHCGQPYFPERKPAIGRRNYCQECRDRGEPQRAASRDWQRGKRAKKNQQDTTE